MSSANSSVRPSKALFYTGWVLSVLPSLLFLMSASMKLKDPAAAAAQTEEMIHWKASPELITNLGIVELVSVILYLVPQTSVMGAILLTGYMGGAICTHLRAGDYFVVQTIIPIVLWLGLYFRDARIRALLPLRSISS